MYEFLKWRMQVNVLRQLNRTYETSNNEATEFVKSGIWTHALSEDQELESGALDPSAILTFYEKGQHLRFLFFNISHQPALLFGLFWT